MKYDYQTIPIDLKKTKRWVLWKKKKNEKGGYTKVPINASTGYGAKSNDNSTWCDFETALNNCDKYNCDGLGIMLGNGLFGVDLDSHEEISADFEMIKNEFIRTLKSYTEYSQSGKGIHIICWGMIPKGANRKGNIEMYDSVRFFALTGNLVEGTETNNVEERTNEIKVLWEKYLAPKNTTNYVFKKERYTTSKLTDNEIFTKASESKSGNLFSCLYYGNWEGIYESQSQADAAFCMMLAFWTNKDFEQMDRIFRKSNLYRPKWDEKRGEKTYGERTLLTAINICRDTYNSQTEYESFDANTGEVITKKEEYELSDTGNAQRFVDTYGSIIKYHFDNKYWVIYDGKTWQKDKKQLIKKLADEMIEKMKKEMMLEPDDDIQKAKAKNIKHLSSNSGKEAMLKEAMHLKNVPALTSDFDKNDNLLNCENGIVDLNTGEILPHNKDFMMSRNTNVSCDLKNDPVLFLKFINETFENNADVVDYIHKCIGYSITGSVQEQCLFQCVGTGGNGKSVLFDVIYEMLGGYSLNIQIDSILARNTNGGNNANSDIARLNGSRWVRTTEPTDGQRFNEGLVKQLTGGDVITARFLYGTEFEFKPKFKLWIACNNEIEVRGTDDGIWRRMRVIKFNRKFDEKTADKMLTIKLKEELPQILGWAVKGCLKWKKEGLEMPEEVRISTDSYKESMNLVSLFCNQNLNEGVLLKEKASVVYNEYKEWAKNGNLWRMNQEKFGNEMSKRYKKKVYGGYVYYEGIGLKKNSDGYVYMKG